MPVIVRLYNPCNKRFKDLEVEDCFPITPDGSPKFAQPKSKSMQDICAYRHQNWRVSRFWLSMACTKLPMSTHHVITLMCRVWHTRASFRDQLLCGTASEPGVPILHTMQPCPFLFHATWPAGKQQSVRASVRRKEHCCVVYFICTAYSALVRLYAFGGRGHVVRCGCHLLPHRAVVFSMNPMALSHLHVQELLL